ncbi:Proline-rich protein 4 [Zea mays]|uniref:Proline-rich protein 4 n=1 Tax=Zea mays TaxID=4577 RepID=A0A317YC17_MAIZE|nr:Proline-rich protein 4 [Zea mays]
MAPERMLLGVCAVLMVVGVTNAAEGQVASVVVGLARCADSTRKNMKAEAGFKGLQVAIKCKNSNGEYETKAVSEIQSSGAFSVPLAADLHGADCHAQLHSAANNAPCPGQEPSRIAPMSGGTFVAVPGKMHYPSAECASAFLCSPIKKHLLDHFHKAPLPVPEYHPVPDHSKPPVPEYHPVPEHSKPAPEYHPPTPVYGQPKPTPIYHPPAEH